MTIPPDNYIGEPGYPAPWATTLPREGLRDTDTARIVSLAPDVCKSPTVPVPYPVVDFCGHDANYTPSVRFTEQKAMVLRSHTTDVHGDEPGVGKGVKSGTVGGISEPIGHASQIRAEGSPVIRHLDRFYMNNRNTVGEAIFVRNVKAYRVPVDTDPLPGSLRLATMTESQTAQAQPRTAPQPAPAPAPAPGPPPDNVIRPDPPQWRRPPPTSPKPPPAGSLLGRLGWFGLRRVPIIGLLSPSPLGDGTLPNWFHDLDSPNPTRRRAAEEAQRRNRADPDMRYELEDWYREETEGLPRPAPVPAPAPDNARIEEDDRRRRCRIASYSVMESQCRLMGMQAHHIVPDWTLRTGTRREAIAGQGRIRNMPGFWDGNSICVLGQARVAGTEHNEAHAADAAIELIGTTSVPPQTATVEQVTRISEAAMIAVRPECAAEIMSAVAGQFGGLDQQQLLRAKQYPPLHPDALPALKSGARRGAAGNP